MTGPLALTVSCPLFCVCQGLTHDVLPYNCATTGACTKQLLSGHTTPGSQRYAAGQSGSEQHPSQSITLLKKLHPQAYLLYHVGSSAAALHFLARTSSYMCLRFAGITTISPGAAAALPAGRCPGAACVSRQGRQPRQGAAGRRPVGDCCQGCDRCSGGPRGMESAGRGHGREQQRHSRG